MLTVSKLPPLRPGRASDRRATPGLLQLSASALARLVRHSTLPFVTGASRVYWFATSQYLIVPYLAHIDDTLALLGKLAVSMPPSFRIMAAIGAKATDA